MATSGVLPGAGFRAYTSSLLVPRVGSVVNRCEDCSSIRGRQPGDRAMGPRIDLFADVGSVVSIKQAYDRLLGFAQQLKMSLPQRAVGFEAASDAVQRLTEVSNNLIDKAEEWISNRSSLGVFSATSGHPGLRVSAESQAVEGRYKFSVVQPARAHKIASSAQSDPTGPLGIEGTLSLEGQSIEVETSDSLISLAQRINAAFDNEASGVTATVDDQNRLILQKIEAGPYEIQLDPGDGTAASLGLITEDELGNAIFATELTSPQETIIEKEGNRYNYESNRIDGLFEGVEIELIPEAFLERGLVDGQEIEQSQEVIFKVTQDISSARQTILDFVGEYNRTLLAYNDEVFHPGPLEGDRSIVALRTRLIRAIEEPVSGEDSEEGQGIEHIGLRVVHRERSRLSELTLRNMAADGVADRALSVLARSAASSSLLRGLNRIGIARKDDGTLEVDRKQLDTTLANDPEAVERILRIGEGSVLNRLKEQLSLATAEGSGILSRRARLLDQLKQSSGKAPVNAAKETEEIRSLSSILAGQQKQLEALMKAL